MCLHAAECGSAMLDEYLYLIQQFLLAFYEDATNWDRACAKGKLLQTLILHLEVCHALGLPAEVITHRSLEAITT